MVNDSDFMEKLKVEFNILDLLFEATNDLGNHSIKQKKRLEIPSAFNIFYS